jgi:spore maturation protein CgeB
MRSKRRRLATLAPVSRRPPVTSLTFSMLTKRDPEVSRRLALLQNGNGGTGSVPLKIIYSHNKGGYEGEQWERELRAASDERFEFIPYNHMRHVQASSFFQAGDLDRLYRQGDPGLTRLYAETEALIRETGADALFVTNYPPYHPEFLLKLPLYKALYTTDDPDSTYRRTIPYLHAYDHLFFCDPAYSPDKTMKQKMTEVGMRNADWLPLGVFDFEYEAGKSEQQLFSQQRDIDIIYVGACFLQKLPILARVQKAFGRSFRMHGFFSWKHNAYFIARHGARQWVRPVSFPERVKLYQRAKIGINVHWDEFGLGNQRLYHLPANGVMQISDCADDLGAIFKPGEEVVSYRNVDELIDRIRYYLAHDQERIAIARSGYRRTVNEYLIRDVTRRAAAMMEARMLANPAAARNA